MPAPLKKLIRSADCARNHHGSSEGNGPIVPLFQDWWLVTLVILFN